MSALTTIYLLSSLGAFLFFLLGRVSSNMLRAAPAAVSPPGPRPDAELERARRDREEASTEAERLRKALDETRQRSNDLVSKLEERVTELEGARAERTKIEQELEGARAECTKLAAELEKSRAEASKHAPQKTEDLQHAETATGDLKKLEERLRSLVKASDSARREATENERNLRDSFDHERLALERRLKDLEAELGPTREALARERELRDKQTATPAPASGGKDLEAQLTTLKSEAARQTTQLATLAARVKELEPRAAEGARLRQESLLLRQQLEALRSPRELDQMKGENKRLRAESEKAAQRIEQLEREASVHAQAQPQASRSVEMELLAQRVQLLEARLFAAGIDSQAAPGLSDVPASAAAPGSVETVLGALLETTRVRSVVLSDREGLLIAGDGLATYHDALGTVAALSSKLALEARSFLPIATVHFVRLSDANGVSFSCRLFGLGGDELALATLGAGSVPDTELDRAAQDAARALGGGADGTPPL